MGEKTLRTKPKRHRGPFSKGHPTFQGKALPRFRCILARDKNLRRKIKIISKKAHKLKMKSTKRPKKCKTVLPAQRKEV